MVVSEVALNDEGDLDGSNLPLAEIIRLPGFAAAMLGHECGAPANRKGEETADPSPRREFDTI